MCVCAGDFTGDPFIQCDPSKSEDASDLDSLAGSFVRSPRAFVIMVESRLFIPVVTPTPVPLNPCRPSPCGANAMCREASGSCVCSPDFYGNPYEGCRPECVINSDCTSNRACIRNRCQDPCPGTCGVNAICEVINHIPACSCQPRYTGDPFRYCQLMQETRKYRADDYRRRCGAGVISSC